MSPEAAPKYGERLRLRPGGQGGPGPAAKKAAGLPGTMQPRQSPRTAGRKAEAEPKKSPESRRQGSGVAFAN